MTWFDAAIHPVFRKALPSKHPNLDVFYRSDTDRVSQKRANLFSQLKDRLRGRRRYHLMNTDIDHWIGSRKSPNSTSYSNTGTQYDGALGKKISGIFSKLEGHTALPAVHYHDPKTGSIGISDTDSNPSMIHMFNTQHEESLYNAKHMSSSDLLRSYVNAVHALNDIHNKGIIHGSLNDTGDAKTDSKESSVFLHSPNEFFSGKQIGPNTTFNNWDKAEDVSNKPVELQNSLKRKDLQDLANHFKILFDHHEKSRNHNGKEWGKDFNTFEPDSGYYHLNPFSKDTYGNYINTNDIRTQRKNRIDQATDGRALKEILERHSKGYDATSQEMRQLDDAAGWKGDPNRSLMTNAYLRSNTKPVMTRFDPKQKVTWSQLPVNTSLYANNNSTTPVASYAPAATLSGDFYNVPRKKLIDIKGSSAVSSTPPAVSSTPPAVSSTPPAVSSTTSSSTQTAPGNPAALTQPPRKKLIDIRNV